MDEKLCELRITDFLERLGSGDPTPGGGASAALQAAQGAALIMMVANHTIGKSAYAEFEELNRRALDEAQGICVRLAEAIDKDAEAFSRVSAAYSMPRSPERSAALAGASAAAAEAPLAVMQDSLAALRLAALLNGRSNRNLRSDIVVAVHSLCAGLRSAACNVDANLPAIEKADSALAEDLRRRESELLAEADCISAEIL